MADQRAELPEVEIAGATVTTRKLAYEASMDLLPEIIELVGIAVENSAEPLVQFLTSGGDVSGVDWETVALALGPVLSKAGAYLGKGRLAKLAAAVMAETTIVATDAAGEKSRYELRNAKQRAEVFDLHRDLFFPVLFYAGKSSFFGFFPVADLIARARKAQTQAPSS